MERRPRWVDAWNHGIATLLTDVLTHACLRQTLFRALRFSLEESIQYRAMVDG